MSASGWKAVISEMVPDHTKALASTAMIDYQKRFSDFINTPGAVVHKPQTDPSMHYRAANRVEQSSVIDETTGDVFRVQVTEPHEGLFTFRIIKGTSGRRLYFDAERCGISPATGGPNLLYFVPYVYSGVGARRKLYYRSELSLRQLARFINAHGYLSSGGRAFVVDGRSRTPMERLSQ